MVEPIGVVHADNAGRRSRAKGTSLKITTSLMPGLIGEVLLPAFEKHYGFKRTAREMEFFAEHRAADVEQVIGRASSAPNIWTHRSSRRALSRSPRRYGSLFDQPCELPEGLGE